VTGYGKEETKRILALLRQKIGLSAVKPAARKPLASAENLLFKQFEGATITPVKVKKASVDVADAPSFVTGYGKKETAKIRALLFKQFTGKESKAPVVEEAAPKTSKPVPAPQPAAVTPAKGSVARGKGFAVWALVALVAILIGTSYSNRGDYFLKEVDGVVQVWQGKFAPSGEELLLTLDGIAMPEKVQAVYTKAEISPIIFDYMMGKSDALLDAPQGPDFGAIKKHLHQAKEFSPTPMLKTRVQNRMRSIDFVVLFHRADIAIAKGELSDLMTAKAYLQKAKTVAFTNYQRDMATRATAVVDEMMMPADP
jgi:hypothetical protein